MARSWREYFEYMRRCTPLVIYYPLCGGALECITACPLGWRIWGLAPMEVRRGRTVLRPVMLNPSECRGCLLCASSCPTAALRRRGSEPRSRVGWVLGALARLLSLPLKPRLLRHLARREHWRWARLSNRPPRGLLEEWESRLRGLGVPEACPAVGRPPGARADGRGGE